MTQEQQLQQLEIEMDRAKRFIDLEKSLDALSKNKHFKKIILEGYFEEEPKRLTMLLADSNMQAPEQQELIMHSLRGIAELRQYFATIKQFAAMSKAAIEEYEQTQEEILAEDQE